VSRRARILAYGSAGLAIVAGVVCAAALGGGLGDALALALVGIGLVMITSLMFLEVGLGEDRARELEQRRSRDRARAAGTPAARHRGRPSGAPLAHTDPRVRAAGRLARMRGQRRRLR
jgi:hypothetical protein